MKSADDRVKDAMHRVEMSWHTDYRSEMIGELEAAVAAFDRSWPYGMRGPQFDRDDDPSGDRSSIGQAPPDVRVERLILVL